MANGLAGGISTGLGGLAAGIQARRQQQNDDQTRQRAAQALSAFPQSGGQLSSLPKDGVGDLLLFPQAMNAILGYSETMNKPTVEKTPPQPTQASLAAAAAGGDERAKSALGLLNPPNAETPTEYKDFRKLYEKPDGTVDYEGLNRGWMDRQKTIFAGKEGIKTTEDLKRKTATAGKATWLKAISPDGKAKHVLSIVNPITGETQYRESGLEAPTSGAADQKKADKQQLLENINIYKGLLEEVDTGRVGGMMARVQGMFGLNDPAKAVDAFRKALARSVGRLQFGETRMTDEDVEQIVQTVPADFMTKSERDLLFKTLDEMAGVTGEDKKGSRFTIEAVE